AQPALADAGRTRYRHQPHRPAAHARVELLSDQAQVGGAADEPGLQRVPMRALSARQSRDGAPEMKRLRLALELVVARVLVGDPGGGDLAGDVVDQHRAGVRDGLHTRGGVDAVAHHHALVRAGPKKKKTQNKKKKKTKPNNKHTPTTQPTPPTT